jgi:hypothetical protein
MADVEWNDHELHELLLSEHGPVGRDLIRRAIRVHRHAVMLCPVDTGHLRSSLTWELGEIGSGGGEGVWGEGLYVDVGTNVEYAPYVEEGTRYMTARPFLRPSLHFAA